MRNSMLIEVRAPFDLGLSLRAAAAFAPVPPGEEERLRLPLRLGERLLLAEARQVGRRPARLEISCPACRPGGRDMKEVVERTCRAVSAGLDLRPFYRMTAGHPVMARVAGRLRGLKPLRPPELFDMAVIAVTEQQISLHAAYRVRTRFLQLFGTEVDGVTAFPSPRELAGRTVEELRACGLSGRKARYLLELARGIVEGRVDLDELENMDDRQAREYLTSLRGFGLWTAEYIMVRGLGRTDVVPADDLGIRSLVGLYLGDGSRMTAEEARRALAPFAPWRGLAAFYLLAYHRLLGPDAP
jgi:DNA-3-methyladenine glycosylase II